MPWRELHTVAHSVYCLHAVRASFRHSFSGAFMSRVTVSSLRKILCHTEAAGQVAVDDWAVGSANLTQAAVLIPIVQHTEELTVLLTRRTAHLRHHAGQISFPGGRVEEGDGSAQIAALRETEEEIGVQATAVELIGQLAEYRTGTGFAITPMVGLLQPPLSLRPDPFEVAEVFEVPLRFLLDPANRKQHRIHYQGAWREYTAIPYHDYYIWGATAGMLVILAQRLRAGEVAGC